MSINVYLGHATCSDIVIRLRKVKVALKEDNCKFVKLAGK